MIPALLKRVFLKPFGTMVKLSVGLSVIVVAGIAVLIHVVDLNQYKGKIEAMGGAALGEPLLINGDVRLGFRGLQPSVVLEGVAFGEEDSILMLDRLEATLSLIGLARGEKTIVAQADNLRLGETAYGDYNSTVEINSEGVILPDIEGKLDDARVKGNASYLADKMEVKAYIRDLDYSQIAEGMKGGNIRADLDLSSQGDILPNLNGTFVLSGGKGTMSGRLVDFWGADLVTSVFLVRGKATKIHCTIGEFRIKNGIARSNVIIIDTDKVTVFGRGTINLVNETLDLTFTPKPKSRAIVNLATPMRVRGTFDAPVVSPETAGAMKKIGTLLLGAVNPAVALVPMVLQDTAGGNPCVRHLHPGGEGGK